MLVREKRLEEPADSACSATENDNRTAEPVDSATHADVSVPKTVDEPMHSPHVGLPTASELVSESVDNSAGASVDSTAHVADEPMNSPHVPITHSADSEAGDPESAMEVDEVDKLDCAGGEEKSSSDPAGTVVPKESSSADGENTAGIEEVDVLKESSSVSAKNSAGAEEADVTKGSSSVVEENSVETEGSKDPKECSTSSASVEKTSDPAVSGVSKESSTSSSRDEEPLTQSAKEPEKLSDLSNDKPE